MGIDAKCQVWTRTDHTLGLFVDPSDVGKRVAVDVAGHGHAHAQVGLDGLGLGPKLWTVCPSKTLTLITDLLRSLCGLTADVEGFALFALADGVVHLALDDGVVVSASHVVQQKLGGKVADQKLVVQEPPVRHVRWIGVRFAG